MQSSLYYNLQNDFPKYVMEGNAETKELDIYHLILAPSYHCNLKCKHCYIESVRDSLSKEVVLKVLDEWNEIVLEERGRYGGIFHLKGGEPLLIPYLSEVLEKLKELRSLRLMITTNGTISNETLFEQLAECKRALNGFVLLIVSLDGATEETHSILRGKGRFLQTLNFLKKLREFNIDFQLNCVLHMENMHEIEKYLKLAREYGAKQVNFLYFIPRGKGANFSSRKISHFTYFACVNNAYYNRSNRELLNGSLPDLINRNLGFSNECVAGYRGLLYITPTGKVYPCPNMVFDEFSLGNILKEPLKDILKKNLIIYKKLENISSKLTCTGEKFLYAKNRDIDELRSLEDFASSINTSPNHISYCYNRNW